MAASLMAKSRFARDAARIATAAVVALSAAFAGPAAAQGGPSRVIVAPVEEREIRNEAPIIGALVATVDSAIAASAAAVVVEAPLQVGDIIEEGEMIARLDDENYRIDAQAAEAALSEARAARDVVEARRELAESALSRAEGLRGSAAFSSASVTDLGIALVEADAAEAQARAAIASAEAQLARAEYFLDRTVIRAPFAGVVTERLAQEGQYIGIGEAAARIVSLDDLEVEIDAPVDRIGALRPGVEVTVQIGLATAPGVVRAVVPRESSSTRTRPVRVSADFSEVDPIHLAPGAAATVMAPTEAPRVALVASKDALVQGNGGWMVFVAEDGAAQPRMVTIGAATGADIEILSGLAEGDLVVVRGNENLRPGQPIIPMIEGEEGAAPSAAAGAESAAAQ